MLRSLIATLVVALCCSNAAFAQVTAVDKATADFNAVAQVVAETRAAMYSAEADLKNLTKAQKDLATARKAAGPQQQIIDDAYNAHKTAKAVNGANPSAQNERAELDAAEAYRKAGSVYDRAKDNLAKIENDLVKKYNLKKATLDAGLATKVAQTKKEFSVLQATLARNERALTDARDVQMQMIVTEFDAVRQELKTISATTQKTAKAVERVEGALSTLQEENAKLLEALSKAQVMDPETAKKNVELYNLLEKLVRENQDNPEILKKANEELKKAAERLPTPLSSTTPVYSSGQVYYTCPPCRR